MLTSTLDGGLMVSKRMLEAVAEHECLARRQVGRDVDERGFAPFFHIKPREPGEESGLSEFFSNVTLCVPGDGVECWSTYVQNELGRRKDLFESCLSSIGFKAGTNLKSFVPLHGPSDDEVVDPGGLRRVQ